MVLDVQNLSAASEGDNNFEVETILAHKVSRKGEIFYLVKWAAFPVKNASWEPVENLSGCGAIIDIYMNNPRPNATKTHVLDLIKKDPSVLTKAVAATAHLLKSNQTLHANADVEADEDDMKVRARKSAFERSEVQTSFEKTADKSAILKDTSVNEPNQKAPKPVKVHGQPAKEFDYKLFLKLGFSVSALIILVFIFLQGGFDSKRYETLLRQAAQKYKEVTKG